MTIPAADLTSTAWRPVWLRAVGRGLPFGMLGAIIVGYFPWGPVLEAVFTALWWIIRWPWVWASYAPGLTVVMGVVSFLFAFCFQFKLSAAAQYASMSDRLQLDQWASRLQATCVAVALFMIVHLVSWLFTYDIHVGTMRPIHTFIAQMDAAKKALPAGTLSDRLFFVGQELPFGDSLTLTPQGQLALTQEGFNQKTCQAVLTNAARQNGWTVVSVNGVPATAQSSEPPNLCYSPWNNAIALVSQRRWL